jgi:hypothetical protein
VRAVQAVVPVQNVKPVQQHEWREVSQTYEVEVEY